jgi:hypothetical protein
VGKNKMNVKDLKIAFLFLFIGFILSSGLRAQNLPGVSKKKLEIRKMIV